MLMNITDVFTAREKVRTVDIPIEMTTFKCRMGEYPITSKSELHLVMTNIAVGKVELSGNFQITQSMQCDRCLQEVPVVLSIEFERTVISPDITDKDELDDCDQGVMNGYQLDIEVLVYNEVLMNQPEKVLCKPNCKGICKKCGKDLNEGECGCDQFVMDPRMAALQDIFNANKEV